MARPIVGQIPPAAWLGPEVEAAENARTEAITARDDAKERVRALMAGGQKFNPLVIGSSDRPSDVEKAAIAADEAMIAEAIEAGADLSTIQTPNRDRYRRDLAEAEARERHYERKVADTEAALIEALQATKDEARQNVRRAVTEASAAYMAHLEITPTLRKAKLEAEAALRFFEQLEQWPLTSLGVAMAGGQEIKVPGRMATLSFDSLLATLKSDAEPPAGLEDPDVDPEADTDDTPAPVTPNADNRFNRDVPRRRRSPVRAS